MVEAPTPPIDGVLKEQKEVGDLVRNNWVRLFALDPESGRLDRLLSDGRLGKIKTI